MSSTSTPGRMISAFALLAVLVSVACAHAASPASAVPVNQPRADHSLAASATAGYVASSADSPTLTSDLRQPSGGAERQLPVGIGLLAVGLLGLVYSLVTLLLPRRQRSLAARGRLASGV